MNRKILTAFVALLFLAPVYGQQADNKDAKDSKEATAAEKDKTVKKEPADAKKGKESVYSDIILEDFEETQYSEKNIESNTTFVETKASLAIRDQFPAPVNNSKKYLGVKILGRVGDILRIRPTKPLVIDKYCKEITIWLYGKKLAGEVSMMIADNTGSYHRVIVGVVDHIGWKKFTIPILSTIKQQDEYLSQKSNIKIIEIQYRPGNQSRLPIWHYFYIDDIMASVREKYTDRQSDDW